MKKSKSFTIVEVMICMTILVVLFVGLISIYLYSFNLQETAKNTSLAINEARAKLEEIKDSNFSNIVNTYNGKAYDLTSIPGGKIRTEATFVVGGNNELIDVRVVAFWSQKGARIIGEDADLDGQLDAGEDANGNGRLDSPVELVTSIRKP